MLQPDVNELFAQAPLARLFLRLQAERLSGTVQLAEVAGLERASIGFLRGRVTKVRTSAPIAYLGIVAYEMGFIDTRELDSSLLALSRARMPHGHVLVERGSITRDQLTATLREQVLRKLTHLLALRGDTQFAFHPDADLLAGYGGEDWPPVDPMPAIWRSFRDSVPVAEVRSVIARLGGSKYRLAAGAAIDRFQLQADERSVVECLRIKPMSIAELHGLGVLPPSTLGLLLFCLRFTGQLEAVAPVKEDAAAPPPPMTPARPTSTGTFTRPSPATPQNQRTVYERAKACLHNSDLTQAVRLAYTAQKAEPDSAYPLALLAWVAALQVEHDDVPGVLDSIAALDRALVLDPLCQDALYYRAQLHTRLQNHKSALRDLKTLLEINPRHMDAVRAYRLYQMRIRSGSVRMRAVDPNLITRIAPTSGVVSKAGSVPPGRVKKG